MSSRSRTTAAKPAGKNPLRRGLAGGVRRDVSAEERAVLSGLKPDAQTQALLDSLVPSAASEASGETRAPAAARGREPAPAARPEPASASSPQGGGARPVELVPVADIAPSPHQTRRFFAGVDELATSILETALQHPVLVRRNPPGAGSPYVLVFGERRHRAFRRLEEHAEASVRERHRAIPAFVLEADELSDARLAVLTAEENAQRAQLTAWELARNVVALKAALDAEAERPVKFDQLARHFQLQAGSTNEYYTIGTAFPESVLHEAGLVRGDEIDWARVAQLKKQRLLAIAKRPPAERVALLRAYAGLDDTRRRRGSGPRFTVEQLRAEGGFTLKIEKPVSSACYTRTQSESFLRDLEPALALLSEIVGEGRGAYTPESPNLPGTYVVLRDRPANLSADERRQALEVVDSLRRELTR